LDDILRSIVQEYNFFKQNKPVGLHKFISETELLQLIDSVKLQSDSNKNKMAYQLAISFFDKFYEQAGGDGHHTLVEKTPNHLYYVDVILDSMPEAKIIEIVRDCRDVRASYAAKAKSIKWADKSTETVSEEWVKSIECGERFRKLPIYSDRIHLVRYEKLKSDTRNELLNMLAFARLNHDDRLVDHIVRESHISKFKRGEGKHINKGVVGDWLNRLSAEDVKTIKSIAGSTMERLNYN